jgi:hypothetical protein
VAATRAFREGPPERSASERAQRRRASLAPRSHPHPGLGRGPCSALRERGAKRGEVNGQFPSRAERQGRPRRAEQAHRRSRWMRPRSGMQAPPFPRAVAGIPSAGRSPLRGPLGPRAGAPLPGTPRPMRVAAKSGARFVALLGLVVPATTFVALRAIIPISRATRLTKGIFRGSLNPVLARAWQFVTGPRCNFLQIRDGRGRKMAHERSPIGRLHDSRRIMEPSNCPIESVRGTLARHALIDAAERGVVLITCQRHPADPANVSTFRNVAQVWGLRPGASHRPGPASPIRGCSSILGEAGTRQRRS